MLYNNNIKPPPGEENLLTHLTMSTNNPYQAIYPYRNTFIYKIDMMLDYFKFPHLLNEVKMLLIKLTPIIVVEKSVC